MKNQIQNQVLERQDNSSSLSVTYQQVETSLNKSIESKIEQMAKSLAQKAKSSPNMMDKLRKLQNQRQEHEKLVIEAEKQMFNDLNFMEKSLLAFDRQKMFHRASSKLKQEQLKEKIEDFEYVLRKSEDNNHEKQTQYREKISNLKVQMIGLQNFNQEKNLKIQRDTINKLNCLQKNINSDFLDSKKDILQSMSKKFRELRLDVQGQTKKNLQQKRKLLYKISEMEEKFTMRVGEERSKQKEAFEQHYKTLQAIFRLLQEDDK